MCLTDNSTRIRPGCPVYLGVTGFIEGVNTRYNIVTYTKTCLVKKYILEGINNFSESENILWGTL